MIGYGHSIIKTIIILKDIIIVNFDRSMVIISITNFTLIFKGSRL